MRSNQPAPEPCSPSPRAKCRDEGEQEWAEEEGERGKEGRGKCGGKGKYLVLPSSTAAPAVLLPTELNGDKS